jgi:hypothetical protein
MAGLIGKHQARPPPVLKVAKRQGATDEPEAAGVKAGCQASAAPVRPILPDLSACRLLLQPPPGPMPF